MILNLPLQAAANYRSASQRARVITEAWALENVYCPACISDSVKDTAANTEAVDFICSHCSAAFQLKAFSKPIRHKILDGAYNAMMRAVQRDALPHFLIMGYNFLDCSVTDLLLIPKFCLSESSIEKRNPLCSTARRAGWVGCNILLHNVPPQGRIPIIQSGRIIPRAEVRKNFQLIKPIENIAPKTRGWTLDVLNVLRSLNKTEFIIDDAYSFENILSKLHPDNLHVKAKIRQQLQILRDMGYLQFEKPGHYIWLK